MATMGSWGFLAIGCCLVLAVFYWIALLLLRDRGVRLATIAPVRRGKMADCKACAGEGDVALMWDEAAGTTTWQSMVQDGRIISTAQLNTKPCPACAGLGHRWVDD